MYGYMDFMNVICDNIDYWNQENVLATAIDRYEKFMHLKKQQLLQQQKDANYKIKPLMPTIDIELVWQAHLSSPENYQRYCRGLCNGLIDHHSNEFTINNTISSIPQLRKTFARTCLLWAKTHKTEYSSLERPDFWAWQRNHVLLSLLVPPVGLYRLIKWRRYSSLSDPTSSTAKSLYSGSHQYGVIGMPLAVMTPHRSNAGSECSGGSTADLASLLSSPSSNTLDAATYDGEINKSVLDVINGSFEVDTVPNSSAPSSPWFLENGFENKEQVDVMMGDVLTV